MSPMVDEARKAEILPYLERLRDGACTPARQYDNLNLNLTAHETTSPMTS